MKEGIVQDTERTMHITANKDADGVVSENGKKKTKEERPATKVVIRRLPPSMTLETFVQQVSPLPDNDYMYFVQGDASLAPNSFSRAYINFVNQADLFIFTQKFDNYVFVDGKGQEYPAVVEFAPFQRIPKHRPGRKKDPKVGTLDSEPAYISFKEKLEQESLEGKTPGNAVKQHYFETSTASTPNKVVTTPLLEFLRTRRSERQRVREERKEERRKKENERRRVKDDQQKRAPKKADADDNVVIKSDTRLPESDTDNVNIEPEEGSTQGQSMEDIIGDTYAKSATKCGHLARPDQKQLNCEPVSEREHSQNRLKVVVDAAKYPTTHFSTNLHSRSYQIKTDCKYRKLWNSPTKMTHSAPSRNSSLGNKLTKITANSEKSHQTTQRSVACNKLKPSKSISKLTTKDLTWEKAMVNRNLAKEFEFASSNDVDKEFPTFEQIRQRQQFLKATFQSPVRIDRQKPKKEAVEEIKNKLKLWGHDVSCTSSTTNKQKESKKVDNNKIRILKPPPRIIRNGINRSFRENDESRLNLIYESILKEETQQSVKPLIPPHNLKETEAIITTEISNSSPAMSDSPNAAIAVPDSGVDCFQKDTNKSEVTVSSRDSAVEIKSSFTPNARFVISKEVKLPKAFSKPKSQSTDMPLPLKTICPSRNSLPKAFSSCAKQNNLAASCCDGIEAKPGSFRLAETHCHQNETSTMELSVNVNKDSLPKNPFYALLESCLKIDRSNGLST